MPKLGSPGRPVVIHVQSMDRAEEVLALADDHGIKVVVGVEENEPEDLGGLERLIAKTGEPVQATPKSAPKIGRNDPCPCGSGKKYKKCCGKA